MALRRLTLRSEPSPATKPCTQRNKLLLSTRGRPCGATDVIPKYNEYSLQFRLVLAIFPYCQFSVCSSWRWKSRTLGPSAGRGPTGEQHTQALGGSGALNCTGGGRLRLSHTSTLLPRRPPSLGHILATKKGSISRDTLMTCAPPHGKLLFAETSLSEALIPPTPFPPLKLPQNHVCQCLSVQPVY